LGVADFGRIVAWAQDRLGQSGCPEFRLRYLAWRLEDSYYDGVKTNLNELIPQLSPSSGFRLYLQSELARRRSSNLQYSLRSFALQLGINHSTLSQLLRGKRELTTRMIETLGARLGLRTEEIKAFVARERQVGNTIVSREIQLLTMETMALLSDGSHRAILELTTLEEFVTDARWIARTLDLTVDEVNMALSRLTRLGLLEMVEPNRWIDRSGARTVGNDGFSRRVINRLSEQVRRLAAAPAEDQQAPAIESTAVRVGISAAQLPAVMNLIERLRHETADLQQEDQEYRVEINLSPLEQNNQTKEQ
jgi:uncharacterized protein (TIGR02147 family)